MKNQYDDLKKEFQDTVAELSKITGWPQEQSKSVLELLADFTAKKGPIPFCKSLLPHDFAPIKSE